MWCGGGRRVDEAKSTETFGLVLSVRLDGSRVEPQCSCATRRHNPSWPQQERSRGRGCFSYVLSFVRSVVLSLVRINFFLGQAWAEGKGELATSRRARTADRNWAVHTYPRHDLPRSHAGNE